MTSRRAAPLATDLDQFCGRRVIPIHRPIRPLAKSGEPGLCRLNRCAKGFAFSVWTTFDRYLYSRYTYVFVVFFAASMGLFAVVDGS